MYHQIPPPPALANYIDAYWISSSDSYGTVRILPDTCTDIVLNMGEDVYANGKQEASLRADTVYLMGNMTGYADVHQRPGTLVYGVRFKPFGLNTLLGFSLSGTADKRIELGKSDFDLKKFITANRLDIAKLNAFFYQCLQNKKQDATSLFHYIQHSGGRISAAELARRQHISERQLERIFADKAGVSMKELCSQVRMQQVMSAIKKRKAGDSLLGIALSAGFYDHAHLTKSLKKHTGYIPSELM